MTTLHVNMKVQIIFQLQIYLCSTHCRSVLHRDVRPASGEDHQGSGLQPAAVPDGLLPGAAQPLQQAAAEILPTLRVSCTQSILELQTNEPTLFEKDLSFTLTDNALSLIIFT